MWHLKLISLISMIILILFSQKVMLEKTTKTRNKRALLFPASSTLGILIALAVPLDLPHRNVFMSYNFEANYNLPFKGEHFIPGPLKRFEFDDERTAKGRSSDKSQKNFKLTRRDVYKILEDKLSRSNFIGKPCLLRLICETNATILGRYNGVLGDIFEIIFTPSLSEKENSMEDYYEAEDDGLHNNCEKYNKICSKSILDLITTYQ